MGKSVIVVDDDPIIRLDLKEMLREGGYEIAAEGKNGEEAIELTHRFNPDLLIMDVKMPKMDGIKASGIIRKSSDVAIVLLTAFSQRELVQKAKQSRITAYLVKPIAENDLMPAIEIALTQRDLYLNMKKDIEELKQTLSDRKVIEKAKGILMDKLDCSENEAYNRMRSESMKKRVSMITIAKDIVQHSSNHLLSK